MKLLRGSSSKSKQPNFTTNKSHHGKFGLLNEDTPLLYYDFSLARNVPPHPSPGGPRGNSSRPSLIPVRRRRRW
jgi:hypothetical protein